MSETPDSINVAVVGVGRMGRHHARTYAENIPHANLLAVVDADEERAATVADQYDCGYASSTEELLKQYPQVQAVSIAVPTIYHLAAAKPLLEKKIACLVEKPLAQTSSEAKQIAALAEQHGATLQVGHTERFNPAVRALLDLNLKPRFLEVHRISPMTFRSLDVSVVMDMMIHDLDIVLMLAGSPIRRVDATGVAIMGKACDIANARLTFDNGCVANVTASRLAFETTRRLRIFSEDAFVSVDYQKRTGVVINKAENDEALQKVRTSLAAGADLSSLNYTELVNVGKLGMDLPDDQQDPLTAELSAFLDAAATGTEPIVTAQAGCAAIDAAERVLTEVGDAAVS